MNDKSKKQINDEVQRQYSPEVYKTESQKLQSVERKSVNSSKEVFELIEEYKNKEQEYFVTILLNTRNQVIEYKHLFIEPVHNFLFQV